MYEEYKVLFQYFLFIAIGMLFTLQSRRLSNTQMKKKKTERKTAGHLYSAEINCSFEGTFRGTRSVASCLLHKVYLPIRLNTYEVLKPLLSLLTYFFYMNFTAFTWKKAGLIFSREPKNTSIMMG